MPPVGFELTISAGERPQTCPLDRTATGTGNEERNTKTNYGMFTRGEKEKRTPKENVCGRSTSSHENKKFRAR
jgi:hypothetical protein